MYFVTGNRADAAELMQDAFLKLWERWDRVDRIDDPTAYLFRVALNGSRMRARAARRAGRRLVTVERDRDPFDEIELREDVLRLLLDLAPRQRAVLVLRYFEDLDVATCARILDCTEGTVKSQTAKALKRLKDLMSEESDPATGSS